MIILANSILTNPESSVGQRKLALLILTAFDSFKIESSSTLRKQHFLNALGCFRELKKGLT
jgi:hypothetical protein